MSSTGKGEARSKPAAARVSEGGLRKRFRAWREQHAYSLLSSLGRFVRWILPPVHRSQFLSRLAARLVWRHHTNTAKRQSAGQLRSRGRPTCRI